MRIAVRSNRETDILLNGQLDLVPLGVVGRHQVDVGESVEVDLVLGVRGERRQTRQGDGKEALCLDRRVDLVRRVVERVERLDRVLVSLFLERHQIVGDTKRLWCGAVPGRHGPDPVVDAGVVGVQSALQRPEPHNHARLALLEEREGTIRAICAARVVLGHVVRDREVLHELWRLDVRGRVERPRAVCLEGATVVEEPDGELALSLLRAEERSGVP